MSERYADAASLWSAIADQVGEVMELEKAMKEKDFILVAMGLVQLRHMLGRTAERAHELREKIRTESA